MQWLPAQPFGDVLASRGAEPPNRPRHGAAVPPLPPARERVPAPATLVPRRAVHSSHVTRWPTNDEPAPEPVDTTADPVKTQELLERFQAVAFEDTAGVIVNAALNLVCGLCSQVGVSRATLLSWTAEMYDAHHNVTHPPK